MAETTVQSSIQASRVPGRGTRIVVGLLTGIGATGMVIGLHLLGTFLDVGTPLLDPSGLIQLAPVVLIPVLSGATLRGPAAIIAIMVGAIAAPVAAVASFNSSCQETLWRGFGLLVMAFYALVISGVSAFAGDWLAGGSRTLAEHRGRVIVVLTALGVLGILAWVGAVAVLGQCAQPV